MKIKKSPRVHLITASFTNIETGEILQEVLCDDSKWLYGTVLRVEITCKKCLNILKKDT